MSFNGSGTFVINSAGQPVVSGTVISSTAFNALTADLANGLSTCITKDGQTTPTADIPMGSNKITGLANGTAAGDAANLGQVQSTVAKLLGSVSGADTITAVGAPTVAAYAAGQMFYFVAAAANTGAVTINIDSLGAKSITRDGTTALAAGDIQSGEVCVIVYDGTQFQLVNGASQSAAIVTNSLTVNGTSSLDGAVTINDSGANVDFRVEGDTDANLLFVDASADNVGIGTSSPTGKLHVSGFAGNVGLRLTRDISTDILDFYQGAGVSYIDSSISGGQLAFATAGTEKMRLTASGNLGLGVTPSAWFSNAKALEYQGGSLWSSATSNMLLMQNAYLDASAAYIYKNNGAASYYSQSSGAHSWYTVASGTAGGAISAWTQAMTLDANSRLSIKGDFLLDSTDPQVVWTAGALRFSTGGSERARITSGGDFLLGTTNTSVSAGAGFKYNANSTDPYIGIVCDASTSAVNNYHLYSTGASAYRFYVNLAGTVFATNTTISAISDVRHKENIRDLDVGLDAVLALKPRKFDWKKGKGKDRKDDRGFIAQEFEQVFPDLIDEWLDPAPEGEEPYKSVRQDLIPVLVKAIQELSAKNDALEARIGALEGAK